MADADLPGRRARGDLYTGFQAAEIHRILPAPSSVDNRFLWEDILTGVVPMVSLARALGCPTPLLEATLTLTEALLGRDLLAESRTVETMGLANLDAGSIRRKVRG